MSYKITIQQGVEFNCDENDTVLRAALRAGINFPYECNTGGCGRCKFEVINGEVNSLWPEATGLSDRDVAKGRQLACQCVPTKDCDIKVRLRPTGVSEIPPVKSTATLYKINRITDDMAEFCFKTEGRAIFKAGQFALLDFVGVEGSRGYSMSNLENKANEWCFIVKRIPNGQVTMLLFDQLCVGENIVLDGPYGLAYLKPNITRDIVCIAGGSGLSPEMAILKAATQEKGLDDRKIYLFYGGRTPADICTPELLGADEGLHRRVINYNAVSDVDAAKKAVWVGDTGFIHELLAKKLADTLVEHEFYICGPPLMIDALTRMLVMEYRVPQAQIHYDRFY